MKYFIVLTLFLLPTLALAALHAIPALPTYTPLVGIPGIVTTGSMDFNNYIDVLYGLSISVAALLAVIKILTAGVKYMLTDIVTTKGEAKKDIQNALVGLLIVLGAVLILNTINPNLTKVDLSLESLDIETVSFPGITSSQISDTAYVRIPLGHGVEMWDSGITDVTDGNYSDFAEECVKENGAPINKTVLLTFRCLFLPPDIITSRNIFRTTIDDVENNEIKACATRAGVLTGDTANTEYSWCVSIRNAPTS